jgi:hypothetical protein
VPRAITGWLVVLAVLLPGTAASATATSDVVDGIDSGGGSIHARIAGDTASLMRDGVPWVFYGANPEYGYRLRLAVLGVGSSFQTLDGAGGPDGRTTDSVGTDVSATRYAGMVHVFFRDDTTATLRHGWLTDGVWRFETIDGDVTAGGRTTDDVGGRSVAMVYRRKLNVVYADDTAGDVRRAVFDGSSWRYSVLDGDSTAGGQTADAVGLAIRADVWGSRMHVLYTRAGGGLREATIGRGSTSTYATLSDLGGDSLGLVKVSDTEVYVAYSQGEACCVYGTAFAAVWDGSSWSVDRYVTDTHGITGITLFLDGGNPYLAAGFEECYGTGGCEHAVAVVRWNGTTFADPLSGPTAWRGQGPPGFPSSAVTVRGVGHLFVGAYSYPSEPDIRDRVLLHVEGPF